MASFLWKPPNASLENPMTTTTCHFKPKSLAEKTPRKALLNILRKTLTEEAL